MEVYSATPLELCAGINTLIPSEILSWDSPERLAARIMMNLSERCNDECEGSNALTALPRHRSSSSSS